MKELKKLIDTSFSAQCRYVLPRIHNKSEREDFGAMYKILMHKITNADVPVPCGDIADAIYLDGRALFSQKSSNMIIDIYKQTYLNMHNRFVTGTPIEGEWLTF